jgi:glucosamine--fructose-6-phosphate aminotransferase (isomerizing)
MCGTFRVFHLEISRFSISLTFSGIFGYLNYLVKRDRKFIADILINGLHRLEYRGYDSSGIAFDGDIIEDSNSEKRACLVVRQKGKVEELELAVKCKKRKSFK